MVAARFLNVTTTGGKITLIAPAEEIFKGLRPSKGGGVTTKPPYGRKKTETIKNK